MDVMKIEFTPLVDSPKGRGELSYIVQLYLGAMFQNGQVWGDRIHNVLYWANSKLTAIVEVPRQGALHSRWASKYVKKYLKEVMELCVEAPTVTCVSEGEHQRLGSWKHASSLILFTNMFDRSSPITAGDSGRVVPVYMLPIDVEARERLLLWARTYQQHDEVYIYSGELEFEAYKVLADPESDLNEAGLDLADIIENATGCPTYYFLGRFYGRKRGERDRRCPLCGEKWWRGSERISYQKLDGYEFRCDDCRLVSQLPRADKGHWAHIGEYQQ